MSKIYSAHGKNIGEMTLDLLKKVVLPPYLKKDSLIGIKPNLVWAVDANSGATTHKEIAKAVIMYLTEKGFSNVCIIESSWVGDDTKKAYKVCGYETLAKEYNVELIDVKDDEFVEKSYKDLKIKISKKANELDYLINLPVIKGHCQTKITCAMKNLKGLIPDNEKRRFHRLKLNKPIAYLNKIITQDLIIADGICPDLGCEDGGNPSEMNKILLGYDPVLIDSYVCKLLGYEYREVDYINIAYKEKIGEVFREGTLVEDIYGHINEKNIYIKKNKEQLPIDEYRACSHCVNNLILALKDLKDEGFYERIVENISIGQGYRGLTGKVGVGDCTKNFEKNIRGCPPKKEEIIKFLREIY